MLVTLFKNASDVQRLPPACDVLHQSMKNWFKRQQIPRDLYDHLSDPERLRMLSMGPSKIDRWVHVWTHYKFGRLMLVGLIPIPKNPRVG